MQRTKYVGLRIAFQESQRPIPVFGHALPRIRDAVAVEHRLAQIIDVFRRITHVAEFGDQLPAAFGRTLVQQTEQRQRDLAFAHIASGGFAGHLHRRIVQNIVLDLKRDAQVIAELPESRHAVGRRTYRNRPDRSASSQQLNISEVAQEIHSKGMAFSEEASRELKVMEDAVSEILYLSIHAFVEGDLAAASRVEPLEEIIDGLCDELKLHHVDRLQKGVCTLSQGFVFNDLLTNFERVADHCSNIAVAMIELESDAFDTHEYLKSVKNMKSDSFARYYEEYSKKFAL